MSERDIADVVPKARMRMRVRLALSLVFAGLIGAIAIQSAWVGARSAYAGHGPSNSSEYRFNRLAECLREYVHDQARLPNDFAELQHWERTRMEQQTPAPPSGIRDGVAHDGWKGPIGYRHEGDHYLLSSLGRDGRVGGVGIDTDIEWDGTGTLHLGPEYQLTFGQFLEQFRDQGRRAVLISGMAALLAGLLSFFLLRQSVERIVLPGLVMLLATGFVAYVMGLIEIVKYH
ncbi:MAG TPA: type II secretion system protein GspG [Planctomycetota bacterium]|jgi:hypothetical protein|nr:type II secretion system protein GspG [Planctomycetota bacterium]